MVVKTVKNVISVKSDRLTISIPDGLVRLDGIPVCRVYVVNGEVWLRFKDDNHERYNTRGARYIDIKLSEFMVKLDSLVQSCF